jgi:hypothetical protein
LPTDVEVVVDTVRVDVAVVRDEDKTTLGGFVEHDGPAGEETEHERLMVPKYPVRA